MRDLHSNADNGFRPLALAGIALTGVLASGALGGLTNAINGQVSPQYFVAILHWEDVQNVWRACVAQGILEGLLFGVFFSLVFTAGVGLITRVSCSYRFGIAHLAGVIAGAFGCWLVGGLLGMGLAALSPEFFRRSFRGVPAEFGPMLAYAWVGGSIWGVQIGGLLSTILGLIILRARWLRPREQDPTFSPG